MVNWSKVGDVAGSLLAGINFLSGGGTSVFKSNQIANHQFNLQKKYTKWLNEYGYSQMRTGLENAGYNPLLAVGATPQSGTIGIANATEGTTAQGVNLNSLADIGQILTNTSQSKAGLLGSIFGTDLVNTAKGMLNDSGISKSFKRLVKKSLNTANGALSALDDFTDNLGSNVLKGYVSNTANSKFDYLPEYDDLGKLPPELSRYK